MKTKLDNAAPVPQRSLRSSLRSIEGNKHDKTSEGTRREKVISFSEIDNIEESPRVVLIPEEESASTRKVKPMISVGNNLKQ